MRVPSRSFILHLVQNCPEARVGLDAWREGEMTFEQAMMETVKRLFLANQELKRQMDYARSPREF